MSGAGEQGKALKDNADPPPVQLKNISLDREFPCFFFLFFFWQSVLRDTRSTIFDAGVFVCRHQVANPTEEDYYHDNPNFTFSFIYGPGNSGA